METRQSELFEKLNSINVNAYTEEKQGLTYLKWMEAFRILQNYVDAVDYRVIENNEGLQYFDTPMGVYVKTEVSVMYKGEKITKTFTLPVLDFKNNQMFSSGGKMIRFNKEIDRPVATMFDINSSIQRCYVKTIAMLGLGSYIYSGFKKPETEVEVNAKILSPEEQEVKRRKELWANFKENVEHQGLVVEAFLKENGVDMKDKVGLMNFVENYLKNNK